MAWSLMQQVFWLPLLLPSGFLVKLLTMHWLGQLLELSTHRELSTEVLSHFQTTRSIAS
jgi:hypothetical protein